jgi:hypothetical protein
MAHVKSSLAPLGKSLGYELREGRFWWLGEADVSAEELLQPYTVEEERSAVEEARNFLRDVLADGEKPAKEVLNEAKKAGISDATLRRARAGRVRVYKAHVVGEKRGRGSWVWSLLEAHDDHPAPLASDEHLEDLEKQLQNQAISVDLRDTHMSTWNGNGNPQQNQSVVQDNLDAHPTPVGHDYGGDPLEDERSPTCGGGDFASLTPNGRRVCMTCLAMEAKKCRSTAPW